MKNNDSKMILEVKEETFDKKEEVKKDSLSKHFKLITDELYKKFGIKLTKKELAPKLGMTYEQFRKKINREQPTKKRDCIIAISAVLGCDTDDTNKALKYNDYMPELDEDSSRDLLIMNILDSHRRRYEDGRDELDYNPDIIDEINNELAANHYLLLDIINHRNTGKEADKIKYPYKLVKKKTTNYMLLINEYFLDWKYLNPCSVHASMEFDDNGKRIVICASSRVLLMDLGEHWFERHDGSEHFKETQLYSDIDETGEFKDSFSELIRMADEELKKSDNIYNDTKNFSKRISARIIDGNIHVFGEMYNYAYPLLNEYYFMDYCNGQYTFTVSNNSRFMKFYLPKEMYKKRYGYTKDKIISEVVFNEEGDKSEGECETEDKNDDIIVYGLLQVSIDKLRNRYFKKLKKKVDKLTEELKSGKEQIHSFAPLKDDLYYIIEIFKAEKEFKCVWEISDYGKNNKDKLLKNINAAPDVDPDFDFETAYEYVKNHAKESNSGISEYADFKDYYSLLYAFYKLKMKQGKTIKEIDAFEARLCEDKKKIVGIGDPAPTFTLADGREVKLNVQDLVDGYTLGIYTIEELGDFKLKHNSLKIEDLLK